MIYTYECTCGKEADIIRPVSKRNMSTVCECGKFMKRKITMPAITGTRDQFGIGKEFIDDKTGKVIDNHRSWEKAGFSDPLDSPNLSSDMKQAVKRKVDKINNFDKGKRRVYA